MQQPPGRGGYPPPNYPGPPHQQQPQVNIRSVYPGGVYQGGPYQVLGKPPTSQLQGPHYPVHPEVRMRKLPFYEVAAELIRPSALIPQGSQRQQDNTFVLHLTPQQATLIGMSRDLRPGSKLEHAVQVQLRFCVLDTTAEQDDCFPPGIMVKVNNKLVQLPNPIPTNKPGMEPKRPPRPVNITPLIKISPTVANTIHIQWAAEYGRGFVVAVNLVQKRSWEDLLNRLKAKGPRASDITREMIQEKLTDDADCEIATTSLRVSLLCPLGKMRMTLPCRAVTCEHLQCFDASLYLQMNERKPTWLCPVCDRPAFYDKLVIDGYFQEVLNSELLTEDINEIQLDSDGSWSFLVCNREIATDPEETTQSGDLGSEGFEFDIDPELAAEIAAAAAAAEAAGHQPHIPLLDSEFEQFTRCSRREEVIDLTLSDSDEEEEEEGEAEEEDVFDDSPIPVKRTMMEHLHYLRHKETKKPATATRASAGLSNSGNRSPSLIILDGDTPPGTPAPLITVATTATMLAPAATVTATAAAAAAAAAKAKAAAAALAAAKAMATAMATATATATLTQAQASVPPLTSALTQALAPALAPAMAPVMVQALAPAMAQAATQAAAQAAAQAEAANGTGGSNADPIAIDDPRYVPPYNALAAYLQYPCHFLDIDGNANYRRF